MKRFIKLLGIFVFFLLLLSICLDAFISYRLRHSIDRMYCAWNGVYLDTTDYDIIVSGPSRAWVQYSPAILDSALGTKTLNIGIDGSCINRQIAKYHAYCREHKKCPELLIQNIDIGTLGETMGYERQQFFPYFFFDCKLINEIDQYESFSWMDKYLPLYRYYGYTDDIIKAIWYLPRYSDINPVLTRGYCGETYKWDDTNFAKMDKIEIAADTIAFERLDKFVCEVTSSGTKIVFVYAPIYSKIYQKCDAKELNAAFGMFETLSAKYNISILDYNNLEMCNDTTMFYNATHLNKKGAEKFSRILAHDLDSMKIISH